MSVLTVSCSLSTSPTHVAPTRPGSVAGDAAAIARRAKHSGALELALLYSEPAQETETRLGAILLLGELRNPSAIDTLTHLTQSDPSSEIRTAAERAIARIVDDSP